MSDELIKKLEHTRAGPDGHSGQEHIEENLQILGPRRRAFDRSPDVDNGQQNAGQDDQIKDIGVILRVPSCLERNPDYRYAGSAQTPSQVDHEIAFLWNPPLEASGPEQRSQKERKGESCQKGYTSSP